MTRDNVTTLKAQHAGTFEFRLYVAGDAPNSSLALTNLTELCNTLLAGRFSIQVIDVFKEPLLALQDSIFMTPTLMKMAPLPTRRIVGTLTDSDTVRLALGLERALL